MESYEVVIIGAGAAGLSAALLAGRSCRKVLVLDGGPPRNAVVDHMHSVLTRDGMNPLDYLAEGKNQLGQYDVTIRQEWVIAIEPNEGGAVVEMASGTTIQARAVIVATGVVDRLPDIPGVAELWGSGVVSCPYCDGWESRGKAIAVIATRAMSGHQALMLTQWSDRVTYFTHQQEINDEERGKLTAIGVKIVDGPVKGLTTSDDGSLQSVEMEDGTHFETQRVFIAPEPLFNDQLLTAIGVARNDDGSIQRDMMGQTSVPRVWVVGDVKNLMGGQVIQAVSEGGMAAVAANMTLITQDAESAAAR